jgi:hypothetical protein
MTTVTVTLADFLLARIAEDEEAARGAAGVPWEVMEWPGGSQVLVDRAAIRDEKWRVGHLGHVASVEHAHDVRHIARHDPARVLAECEAKRRIIEESVDFNDLPGVDAGVDFENVRVLTLLAAPYADHPDYRNEWRP